MNKFKKTLSVVMAALMLVFTVMTYVPANAAENTTAAPQIAFVGIDHSPLVVGDTETFTVTTLNADKVMYQISLKDAAGKVEDLTNGFTAAVDATVPYAITPAKKFELGKYSLIVTAKRASDSKTTTYTAAVNCVSKDDASRVYANGAVQIDKTNYTVGDKVVVNGIAGIAGITGPYKYKLHVYNATTNTWVKNVQANYADKIEWLPTAPGTYVLDIYANTEKSTTWATYAKNPTSTETYGTYEAWKLLVVTVDDTFKVTSATATSAQRVAVKFNKAVDKTEAEKVANYKVGGFTVSKAVLQADETTVVLSTSTNISGTNLYVVNPITLKDSTTVKTPIFTSVETYSDTVAPAVAKVEYPTYDKAKVTFSEPLMGVGSITATQDGATVTLPQVAADTDLSMGVVTFDLAALAKDKPITVVMVGTNDLANNLINPNPTTLTLTKVQADTTKPTVVEVKALSDVRVQVKFSEKLKANPTVALGLLNATSYATDDNITYTATFTTSVNGIAVCTVSNFVDPSGNIGDTVTKVLQLAQDTTAPTLASSALKTFNNKLYLVLNFSEDVTPQASAILAGTYVEDYVTKTLSPAVTVSPMAYTKANGADVDNSKAVMLDVTALTKASYTLTIPAGTVKDLASTPLPNAAFQVSFAKGDVAIVDTVKPVVSTTTVPAFSADNSSLTVVFSKDMDPATALNVNNYKIGGASIFTAAIFNGDAKTVKLTVNPGTIVYGGVYNLNISGLKDKAGNVLDAYTSPITLKANVKPVIASAKLTTNSTITVTFSANVTVAVNSFKVYVNGTEVTATATAAAAGNTVTVTMPALDSLSKTVQVKLINAATDANGNTSATENLVTVTY